jgi:transposase-like protein
LVQAGLLSADDIAEEVTQLKAEAKAWRARSAAAASAGAQPAPHVTAAALAAPPPGPAPRVGKLSPADATPAVQARSSQASSLSNSASGAHARSAAAARDRTLKAAKARKPEAAPAGSKGILTFPGFTREVNVRGVLTAVMPVALNFGRFRCAHSPACSFTTDFQNALTVHQRYCKFDAAAQTRRAVGAGAGEGSNDSDDSSDDGAAPAPVAKRQRAVPVHEDGRKRNRGAKKRHQYSFETKAEILHQCEELMEEGATAEHVADSVGVSASLLSKWRKQAEAIYTAAGDDLSKSLSKHALKSCAGTARYPAMEAKLIADIRRLSASGRHLSIRWLVTRARALFKAEYSDTQDVFLASRSWRRRFARRHGLTRLAVSNTKSKSVAERLPAVQQFHQRLALLISAPPPAPSDDDDELPPLIDAHWGRFLPSHRFNLDQVGLPFIGALGPTFEFIGTPKVQVKTQAEGLSKRQATIQLCFGPTPRGAVNNKISVIFRGTGKRICAAEIHAYDPRVVVQFQPKAWMDRVVAQDWLERVWEPLVGSLPSDGETLLFLDNLDAHCRGDFLPRLRRTGALARFFPPSCTDIVQPVDAGAGALMIKLYTAEQDKWLDIEENLELWESAKISASQRRVLMTRWLGEAWDVFNSPQYDHTRRRYFEKTGCLMTADGTDDRLITPEGTTGYKFVRLDPSSAPRNSDDADTPEDAAAPPDSDCDDADDANLGDHPDEFGSDDPTVAPHELMSFAEMVKLTLESGEQMRMLSTAPPLDANLVGMRVALRVVDIGWCAGTVCGRSSSAEVISYNYSVRYDADDVQQHWLKEARYVGNAVASAENDWHGMDAHPPGSWAVFYTGVLPRAPQAGRTADLRAAPLELVALGGAAQRHRL